ncbi:hypothetical protein [Candidatus Nitrospira bockiana]
MILAVSRFKVLPGFEAPTTAAFQQRPGLVEYWPGFLGLETYLDEQDRSILYLHSTPFAPVVLMSGDHSHARKIKEYGAAGFLPKPIDRGAFVALVRDLVRT